ncbi:hypothetical protein BS17DRAFT_166368, partial [Gyrodon lividus]
MQGILHCSVVEGSFCTKSFTEFIRGLLDHMKPIPPPIQFLSWTTAKFTSTPTFKHSSNQG